MLHSFGHGTDGNGPGGDLIFDAAGNLYGTTYGGGINPCEGFGCGTVFELSPRQGGGWTEEVLHSFNGTGGQYPYAGLVFDAAGNLYGTTSKGGIQGAGTIFELSPRQGGGWTERVLHSFGNGTDGAEPRAGLILDGAGNLYGTTVSGGIHLDQCGVGCGTVFQLSPQQGGGWTETLLHSFSYDGMDGVEPFGGLVFDAAGNLYGTTFGGGIHATCYQGGRCGTVFELSPRQGGGWTETVLHSFDGTDGYQPNSALLIDGTGNLFGMTQNGGIHPCFGAGCGTVFELSPRQGGGWIETVLHSFNNSPDGYIPEADLVFDGAGNLYGTTLEGGIHTTCFGTTCGAVFKIAP